MVHRVGCSCLRGLVLAFGVVVLAAGSTAAAQFPAAVDPEFARLQEKLREGDTVIVTDLQGRSVKGRFGGVSAEEIRVLVNGMTQAFPAASVRQVKRKRMGVMLGALIGAGAGGVMAAFFSSWGENEGGMGGAVIASVALGLGAGVGIDAAVNIPRTVYKREVEQLSIVPIVGPGRVGARVAVRF